MNNQFMLKYRQQQQKSRRNMTCIIGALCAEGVVIVADSRSTNEFQTNLITKFHQFWNGRVIVACAGVNSVIDRFIDVLNEKTKDSEPASFKQVYETVEDSVSEVKTRYFPKLGHDYDIELLVGGLGGFDRGEPILNRVDRFAVTENISKFDIIGHGKPYAMSLFKLMYDNMLTLRETAILGSFVITSIVSMELDQTVGISNFGPEVIVIRDNNVPEYYDTAQEDFRLTNDMAKSLEFRNALVMSIWNKIPQAYSQIQWFR